MKILLAFALLFNSFPVQANELDKELSNFKRSPIEDAVGTFVIKKDLSTGEVQLAYSEEVIPSHKKLEDLSGDPLSFKNLESSNYKLSSLQELDNDNSRESWFFFWGLGVVMGAFFAAPVYAAAPYWGYSYGGYAYTYCYPRYYWY